MEPAGEETRLLWPALRGFYDPFFDVAYALMRIVIGYILLMHGWTKVGAGAGAIASNVMAKNGLEPAIAFAYAAMFLETVGAICIILGLFTRFFAAALAIGMAIGGRVNAFARCCAGVCRRRQCRSPCSR